MTTETQDHADANSQKPHRTDARTPVNTVRLADDSLRTFVVDDCVLCGERHTHGAKDPAVASGGRSHRTEHCRGVDHTGGYYLALDRNAAPPREWFEWLDVDPPADLDARPGTRATRDRSTSSHRRETPAERTHQTYERPHWETVHVGGVDRLGAFESAPVTDDRSDETVRVDLDGVGSGGASAHDHGENVQVSIFLTPETAAELAADLGNHVDAPRAAADGGGVE